MTDWDGRSCLFKFINASLQQADPFSYLFKDDERMSMYLSAGADGSIITHIGRLNWREDGTFTL
jgi:hypothetical protein